MPCPRLYWSIECHSYGHFLWSLVFILHCLQVHRLYSAIFNLLITPSSDFPPIQMSVSVREVLFRFLKKIFHVFLYYLSSFKFLGIFLIPVLVFFGFCSFSISVIFASVSIDFFSSCYQLLLPGSWFCLVPFDCVLTIVNLPLLSVWDFFVCLFVSLSVI